MSRRSHPGQRQSGGSRRFPRIRSPSRANHDEEPLMENDTFTDQFYSSVNSDTLKIDDTFNDDPFNDDTFNSESLELIPRQSGNRSQVPTANLPRRQSSKNNQTSQRRFIGSRSKSKRTASHRVLVPPDEPPLPPNINPAKDYSVPCCSHGLCCCQCVRTQEIGFRERCGEFQDILGPGLHCMCWPINTIAGRLSLRIQQLDITCETITQDKVFCNITVSVLYKVASGMSYEAYYTLVNPHSQIEACVLDIIRSTVPNHNMDDIFDSKDIISTNVSSRLEETLLVFGYEIVTTLVQKIAPDVAVQESMNEISASRRIKEAAPHKAEATKISLVKKAEGDAERSYLMGEGIAKERQALVEGMKDTVLVWSEVDVRTVNPPSPKDIMDILLVTQYLDLLNSLNPDVVMANHDTKQVNQFFEGILSK